MKITNKNKPTPNEMIMTQFRKAKLKGYATNFIFENECCLSNQLKPQEECLVRISATDGSEYHLTNERILHKIIDTTKEVVSYDQIKKVYWIVKNPEPKERAKLMRTNADTFIIDTKIGLERRIEKVGDSRQPLLDFFDWYARTY